MPGKTVSIARVGWMAPLLLANVDVGISQGVVGDASTRFLSRGLATTTSTTSTTSTTNTCPEEAQACLADATCAACFQKPQSAFCVSEYLEGDLTCDGVFTDYFCCEYGTDDDDSCLDNALLLEVFGCNASEAGCTLTDSCESTTSSPTSAAATDAADDSTTDSSSEPTTTAATSAAATDATADSTTDSSSESTTSAANSAAATDAAADSTTTDSTADTEGATGAGTSIGRSGAAVLCSTAVVTGLLAVVLDTLL